MDHDAGQGGDDGLEQHEGDDSLDGPLEEGVYPHGKSAVLVSYKSVELLGGDDEEQLLVMENLSGSSSR